MNTQLARPLVDEDLESASNDTLNRIFSEEVAAPGRSTAGVDSEWYFGPPGYSTSMNLLEPFLSLQKSVEFVFEPEQYRHGKAWFVCVGDILTNKHGDCYANSMAKAACIALIRAVRKEGAR